MDEKDLRFCYRCWIGHFPNTIVMEQVTPESPDGSETTGEACSICSLDKVFLYRLIDIEDVKLASEFVCLQQTCVHLLTDLWLDWQQFMAYSVISHTRPMTTCPSCAGRAEFKYAILQDMPEKVDLRRI